MNNTLSNNANNLPDYLPLSKNSLVAATAILVLGICYCTTITINAKYNRDTEMTYKDFSLKIHASSSNIAPVPIA